MLKKYLFLSLLVLSLLVSPLIINAQTPSDVAGYIAELQRQIAVFQEQLARLQGLQTRPFCYNFGKNFGVGSQSVEVTNLDREYQGIKDINNEAIEALTKLGYQRKEILNTLKDIPSEITKTEEIITYFLKYA